MTTTRQTNPSHRALPPVFLHVNRRWFACLLTVNTLLLLVTSPVAVAADSLSSQALSPWVASIRRIATPKLDSVGMGRVNNSHYQTLLMELWLQSQQFWNPTEAPPSPYQPSSREASSSSLLPEPFPSKP
ncbi:MAG: hypothetical protein SFZ03_10950 [Candidatus Melainabacteria bacterium]|nr:hypothetical protein [Candidatus Melainabacteria bacterium]